MSCPNLLFYDVLAWDPNIKKWSARIGQAIRRRQTAATDVHRRLRMRFQPCASNMQ